MHDKEQPLSLVYAPPRFDYPAWDAEADVYTLLGEGEEPLAFLLWDGKGGIAYLPARGAPADARVIHEEIEQTLREGASLGRDVLAVRDEILASFRDVGFHHEALPRFFDRHFPQPSAEVSPMRGSVDTYDDAVERVRAHLSDSQEALGEQFLCLEGYEDADDFLVPHAPLDEKTGGASEVVPRGGPTYLVSKRSGAVREEWMPGILAKVDAMTPVRGSRGR